jgi:hypothetical protein
MEPSCCPDYQGKQKSKKKVTFDVDDSKLLDVELALRHEESNDRHFARPSAKQLAKPPCPNSVIGRADIQSAIGLATKQLFSNSWDFSMNNSLTDTGKQPRKKGNFLPSCTQDYLGNSITSEDTCEPAKSNTKLHEGTTGPSKPIITISGKILEEEKPSPFKPYAISEDYDLSDDEDGFFDFLDMGNDKRDLAKKVSGNEIQVADSSIFGKVHLQYTPPFAPVEYTPSNFEGDYGPESDDEPDWESEVEAQLYKTTASYISEQKKLNSQDTSTHKSTFAGIEFENLEENGKPLSSLDQVQDPTLRDIRQMESQYDVEDDFLSFLLSRDEETELCDPGYRNVGAINNLIATESFKEDPKLVQEILPVAQLDQRRVLAMKVYQCLQGQRCALTLLKQTLRVCFGHPAEKAASNWLSTFEDPIKETVAAVYLLRLRAIPYLYPEDFRPGKLPSMQDTGGTILANSKVSYTVRL